MISFKEFITDEQLQEKRGLWDNIHARRKKGLPPKKPGQEGYPKTLNIEHTEDELDEATFQGKEVPLNKPMKGDVKKSKVYVDPDGDGKAQKVNFGDPNLVQDRAVSKVAVIRLQLTTGHVGHGTARWHNTEPTYIK